MWRRTRAPVAASYSAASCWPAYWNRVEAAPVVVVIRRLRESKVKLDAPGPTAAVAVDAALYDLSDEG